MHFNSAGTWNVHTRKTDPMAKPGQSPVPKSAHQASKTKSRRPRPSHSEPEPARQSHYTGVGVDPWRTRTDKPQSSAPTSSFRPTTGPQPPPGYDDTGTGTQQTDTGAHTGSTGPHQDHPHTYGPRAPTGDSIDVSTTAPTPSPQRPSVVKSMKEAFTGAAKKALVGDIISREEAARLASIALTGLPEATSNMEKLVALARASYVNQQNKYNVVF